MNEKIAIYAGSFDPLTNGHMDIILRASHLFDKLIVTVATNPEKKYSFSSHERACVTGECCVSLPNVKITQMDNELLVHYAKKIGASHLVRGIRSHKDFYDESLMQHINKDIDSFVETVFFIPNKEYIDVSSSLVKNLIGPKYWHYIVKRYVPNEVFSMLVKEELRKECEKIEIDGKIFEEIWNKYSLSSRHYHNATHILDTLFDVNLDYPYSLDIKQALLYHDIEDNEEESCKTFESLSYCHPHAKSYIKKLIMATKHSRSDYESFSNEEKLIHDIDLSILAASPEVYKQYRQNVLKEYVDKFNITNKEFYEGRSDFLTKILRRTYGEIFLHENFKKYEAYARENMENELHTLEGMIL